MWRSLLSFALMFGSVAWAAAAGALIFGFGVGLWEALFGASGGVVAATVAFALAMVLAHWLTKVADRLLGVETGDSGRAPYQGELTGSEPVGDWRQERSELFRNKRWAFYRRTRQFERLEALEADEQRRPTRRRPG